MPAPAEPPVTVAHPTEPYVSGFIPLDPPVVTNVEAPALPPIDPPMPLPAPDPSRDGLLWTDLEA
jgi:hypothetical protein